MQPYLPPPSRTYLRNIAELITGANKLLNSWSPKNNWYTTCTGDRNIEREGGLSGSLEDAVPPFTLSQDASCGIEKLQSLLEVFRRKYF